MWISQNVSFFRQSYINGSYVETSGHSTLLFCVGSLNYNTAHTSMWFTACELFVRNNIIWIVWDVYE